MFPSQCIEERGKSGLYPLRKHKTQQHLLLIAPDTQCQLSCRERGINTMGRGKTIDTPQYPLSQGMSQHTSPQGNELILSRTD
jgi:hypothetical protein